MFSCCECCVLSGKGLCDELITLPEESYRLWCVVVCDLETSWLRRPWPTGGCCARNKQKYIQYCYYRQQEYTWRETSTGIFIKGFMYSTWKLLRDWSVSTFSVSGESISESRPLLSVFCEMLMFQIWY